MNARHVITRSLDKHCDRIHPEQASRIMTALGEAGFAIVPLTVTKEHVEKADAAMNNTASGGHTVADWYGALVNVARQLP